MTTTLGQNRETATTEPRPERQERGRWASGAEHDFTNVGRAERGVSVAAGALLALLGLGRGTGPGLLMAGVGGALVYRGVTGHCPAYEAVGFDTAHGGRELPSARQIRPRQRRRISERIARRGIEVEQAVQIQRQPQELYDFWRNLENLPRIMSHLDSVRTGEGSRSHWVAKAPRIAGGTVEWDAQITRDEPGSVIGWQSMPGSNVDSAGEVRFEPAMGDRGTTVHVRMRYVPPAGRIGHWIAAAFGQSPRGTVREDLRSFKRLMEVGEVISTAGQPRGTCTGRGKRERA